LSGNGRYRVLSSFDRPRRRFVQDGEVPVTVVNARPRQGLDALGPPRSAISPHERAEAAEAALGAERSAHERTERLLREAQASLLDLQTKQGHAELARGEAEQLLSEARAELAALREELATARIAQTTFRPASLAVDGSEEPVRRKRGRPRKIVTIDPDSAPIVGIRNETGWSVIGGGEEPVRRKRGRPRKIPAINPGVVPIARIGSEAGLGETGGGEEPVRRKRGRPRKILAVDPGVARISSATAGSEEPVRRKRGRPRKIVAAASEPATPAPRTRAAATGRAAKPRIAGAKAATGTSPKPVKWWLRGTAQPKAAKPTGRRRGPPPAL